jgi:hypothetical protein
MSRTTVLHACGWLALVAFCGFGFVAAGRAAAPAAPVGSVVVSGQEHNATDLLLAQGPAAGGNAADEGEAATADGGPAAAKSPPPDSLAGSFDSAAAAEPGYGLAGTPNMFGDLSGFYARAGTYGLSGASLPLVGIGGRMKIADDDNALPQDRVFFLYNHFNDALNVSSFTTGGAPVTHSFDLDRYTIGIEKTFLDQSCSVELRMPFTNAFDYSTSLNDFAASDGPVGNLVVVLKGLLYASDTTAAAVGTGLSTPTGSNAAGMAQDVQFTVHNQSLHLMPFAGFLHNFNDRLFCQGFLQCDVPVNGNRIDYVDPITPGYGSFGVLRDQPLLYADLCTGCWLRRNQDACWLTGLAALVELHYTSTLQNADIVSGVAAGEPFLFGNFSNRQDLLNMTFGLHAEIAHQTVFRVAGAVPLRNGDERVFDAEVLAQVERRF